MSGKIVDYLVLSGDIVDLFNQKSFITNVMPKSARTILVS